MLRIRLLGTLAVELDGTALEPPAGRRARELLAWLALHPGLHDRGMLAARFWPDVLDASARGSLRTALHELRAALGPAADRLAGDRSRVGLAPEDLWVDVAESERLARAGSPEEALGLCRGDLVPDLDAEWALAARQEQRDRVAGLLGRLADEADAAGDSAAAQRWARRLVAHDGLSEEGARRLMRALAAGGDRPAALAAYAALERRLRRELGVAPSPATRELAARIRAGGLDAPPPAALAPPRLPSALRRAERSALVGRGPELARAGAALHAAVHGGSRIVLVGGEPGIGKTRLLTELARRRHAAGALVLFGRCSEEPLAPYQPFVEALAPLVAPGDAELAPLLAPEAVPDGGEALDGARWRLFEAVAHRLSATGAPVLLAIDDLHWADQATLLLLAHLASRADGVALAASYRESELSRDHPLSAALAELHRAGGVERIVLRGLSQPEVAELLGVSPAAPVAHSVHAETGGNPFFVEEVARHLADSGERAIPQSVRDVIGRRLSRLRPETDRVLQLAAVAGREFDLDLLERLDALAGVDVLGALEEAQSAQLVREEPGTPGRYGFVHALIRETLYAELSLARRVRTHAALAAALEELDDGRRLAELAHHHLEAAAGGDPARAVQVALRAARAAEAGYAYAAAAALCDRALQALEGRPDADATRTEVLLRLGEARLRAGATAAAADAFRAAAQLARAGGDTERLARAALGASGLGVRIIAVDHDRVTLLRDALSAGPPPALRARVVARLAIESYYASTPRERKALGDEAVALARESGDERALADALNALHVALWSAEFLSERLATAGEMVALAARLGDPERELQGRNWRVLDLAESGDLAGMRAEIEAHERLADRLRLPGYRWWGPMWRASLATLEGRFADAERLIAEGAEIGREAQDDNAALYAEIQQFAVEVTRGQPWEPDWMPLDRETGRPAEYAYRAGAAWVLAANGRLDAARGHLDWILHGDRVADDMNRLAALCEMSETIARLGGHPKAAAVYDWLAPYADRNVVNARAGAGYGSAARALGLLAVALGDADAAISHFEAAIEHNTALGARPWRARTRAHLAELIEPRDAARADALRRAAAAEAREIGLADWVLVTQ
jgi:DNA-binding SARP family transcriptional activator